MCTKYGIFLGQKHPLRTFYRTLLRYEQPILKRKKEDSQCFPWEIRSFLVVGNEGTNSPTCCFTVAMPMVEFLFKPSSFLRVFRLLFEILIIFFHNKLLLLILAEITVIIAGLGSNGDYCLTVFFSKGLFKLPASMVCRSLFNWSYTHLQPWLC